MLAIAGSWIVSAAAEDSVVALPTIHVRAKVVHFHGKRALLVESIVVGNIEGMVIQVSCDRCERYRTKVHETRPTAASKRFDGVSWIVIIGRDIQVDVRHAGQQGRFLLLGASARDTLVYKATGCLAAASGRRISCPQAAPSVPKESGVAGGNPATKSGGEPRAQAEAKKKAEEAVAKKKAEEEAAVKKKAEQEAAAKKKRRPKKKRQRKGLTPRPRVALYTHGPTNSNAGGNEGPSIPSNDTVQIACKVTGFKVEDGDTWWYRIASSPWNGSYYGSADAFYNNGQTSGSLHGTPFVDPNVPNC